MNTSNVITAFVAHPDSPLDRALDLLTAAGFEFELVERCPTACKFCDDTLDQAA